MSTATEEQVVVLDAPRHRTPAWTRIKARLNNWGRKIKSGGSWLWNKIRSGFKWLVNLTPVRWAVTKTKAAGAFLWHYAKGPAGVVVATIAAIFVAPKAVAVMLALVVVCLVVVGFLVWKTYREVNKKAPEEMRELVDNVNATFTEGNNKMQVVDTEPLDPTETVQQRLDYLDDMTRLAIEDGKNPDLVSELSGRMHLLEVRGPIGRQALAKDATSTNIYHDARKKYESERPDFPWNWVVMNNAVRNEDVRLREVRELKQHQAKATKKATPASR